MLREFRKTKWYGGLSDSVYTPTDTTFEKGYNVDIFSNPGVAQISPLVSKESGAVVTDLCNFAFIGSDGSSYWFSSGGKVYKRTSAGTWTNVYTDAGGAILGAAEYNGYVFWATDTKLHCITIANAGSENPWATIDGIAGFPKTLTSSAWHPMVVQSIYLNIGNANTIATVDDLGTFTSSGTPDVTLLTLKTRNNITCLIAYGEDILAGTQYDINTTVTPNVARTGYLCRWDMASEAFISITEVPDNGVYALGIFENTAIAFCGLSGGIYTFDGTNVNKIKKIPMVYTSSPTPSNYYYVNPGNVTNFKGKLIFGGKASGFDSAVFEIGRVKYGYPLALSPTYAPSNVLTYSFGAVVSIGNTFLISSLSPAADYGVWSMSTAYVATEGGIYFEVPGDVEKNKTYLEYAIGWTGGTAFTGTITGSAYTDIFTTIQSLAGSTIDEGYKIYYQKKIITRLMLFYLKWVFSGSTAVGSNKAIDSFYTKWTEDEKL